MSRTELVLEIAREVGFDLAGVAPLRPPAAAERFEAWLAAGHHADMAWLERQRERIVDPGRILPGGRSLVVVGLAHSRPPGTSPEGGRIARYALARDYHNAVGRLLRKLARRLEEVGLGGRHRRIVDAGPLLERSHAAEAGLGFESKAANLLHPRFGPWFFLGELLVPWELEPTPHPPTGSCGTCTACIDACPTGAIVAPGVVDARACLSYQTIENRGSIPRALRERQGPWAFGCDVCSEVCPWGKDAPDRSGPLGTHPEVATALAGAGLVRWVEMPPAELEERLAGSPLRRPGRAGLVRNAAIALGNLPSERGERALLHALTFDPSALVREAAAWGLARGHGDSPDVRAAIERASAREPEAQAAAELRRALER